MFSQKFEPAAIQPHLFSPPGMPARLAIYFAHGFFYFLFIFLMVDLGANRSQELLNGSLPKFQGWYSYVRA